MTPRNVLTQSFLITSLISAVVGFRIDSAWSQSTTSGFAAMSPVAIEEVLSDLVARDIAPLTNPDQIGGKKKRKLSKAFNANIKLLKARKPKKNKPGIGAAEQLDELLQKSITPISSIKDLKDAIVRYAKIKKPKDVPSDEQVLNFILDQIPEIAKALKVENTGGCTALGKRTKKYSQFITRLWLLSRGGMREVVSRNCVGQYVLGVIPKSEKDTKLTILSRDIGRDAILKVGVFWDPYWMLKPNPYSCDIVRGAPAKLDCDVSPTDLRDLLETPDSLDEQVSLLEPALIRGQLSPQPSDCAESYRQAIQNCKDSYNNHPKIKVLLSKYEQCRPGPSPSVCWGEYRLIHEQWADEIAKAEKDYETCEAKAKSDQAACQNGSNPGNPNQPPGNPPFTSDPLDKCSLTQCNAKRDEILNGECKLLQQERDDILRDGDGQWDKLKAEKDQKCGPPLTDRLSWCSANNKGGYYDNSCFYGFIEAQKEQKRCSLEYSNRLNALNERAKLIKSTLLPACKQKAEQAKNKCFQDQRSGTQAARERCLSHDNVWDADSCQCKCPTGTYRGPSEYECLNDQECKERDPNSTLRRIGTTGDGQEIVRCECSGDLERRDVSGNLSDSGLCGCPSGYNILIEANQRATCKLDCGPGVTVSGSYPGTQECYCPRIYDSSLDTTVVNRYDPAQKRCVFSHCYPENAGLIPNPGQLGAKDTCTCPPGMQYMQGQCYYLPEQQCPNGKIMSSDRRVCCARHQRQHPSELYSCQSVCPDDREYVPNPQPGGQPPYSCKCPEGYEADHQDRCVRQCPQGQTRVYRDGKPVCENICEPEQVFNPDATGENKCEEGCPTGTAVGIQHRVCCPLHMAPDDASGDCVVKCAQGEIWYPEEKKCVKNETCEPTERCSERWYNEGTKACACVSCVGENTVISNGECGCLGGFLWDAVRKTCVVEENCPPGHVVDPKGTCVDPRTS